MLIKLQLSSTKMGESGNVGQAVGLCEKYPVTNKLVSAKYMTFAFWNEKVFFSFSLYLLIFIFYRLSLVSVMCDVKYLVYKLTFYIHLETRI